MATKHGGKMRSNYKENRERVKEIYGFSKKDRSINTHHICDRASARQGHFGEDFDLHEKSNLYPLPIEDHDELHRRIDQLEKGIKREKQRKNKTTKRKPKRSKRSRRRF